jgi:hypothetical protein
MVMFIISILVVVLIIIIYKTKNHNKNDGFQCDDAFYYPIEKLTKDKIYSDYKSKYQSGKLKEKGRLFFKTVKIGTWHYGDENGNIQKVNEDEKFGQFDYKSVTHFFKTKEGYTPPFSYAVSYNAPYTGGIETFSISYNNDKKVWFLSILLFEPLKEHCRYPLNYKIYKPYTQKYTIDSISGKIVHEEAVYLQ